MYDMFKHLTNLTTWQSCSACLKDQTWQLTNWQIICHGTCLSCHRPTCRQNYEYHYCTLFPSHGRFCKLCTFDMSKRACHNFWPDKYLPIGLTQVTCEGHWGESVSHDRRYACNPGVGSRTLWRLLRHTQPPQLSDLHWYEQT